MMRDEALIRQRWAAVRDAFPWERCAEVFRAKGWLYGTNLCGDTEQIPTAGRLREVAEHLFESAILNTRGGDHTGVTSGRILVFIAAGEPRILTQALEPDLYGSEGIARGFHFWKEACAE